MSRRTTATASARANDADAAAPAFRPGEHEVLIRMYGQGIGDCFLLAFPRSRATGSDPERPVYVLIDCGVLHRTPGAKDRILAIVEDIRRTTRDDALPAAADGEPRGHLDLLIVTHEHWDHLSGFIYAKAREAWDHIQVDALWTAWTAADDPEGLAGVLGRLREQQEQALQRIAARAPLAGNDPRWQAIAAAIAFLGESPAFALSTRDGLERAKSLVNGDYVCCEPGEVRPVPGSDAVAYVLGPPRTWARLSVMDPDPDTPETFGHEAGFATALAVRRLLDEPSSFTAFVTPLLDPPLPASAGDGDEGDPVRATRDVYNRSFPFDRSSGFPIPTAELETAAEPGAYPPLDAYFDDVTGWRRIDADWLLAAEGFALWVDTFVNNTSLVLAFELPAADHEAERKVLLFVADAQVGNWLSWDDLRGPWQRRDGARPAQEEPDIDDLLRRTVFYKVGHHGSHNATLKAKGIERMRGDGGLTAFVPVSAALAHHVGWDEMPLPELLDALAERTGGRVVLADGGVWPPLAGEAERREAGERIGLRISAETLPAKRVRDDDGQREIEAEVPLWVQIAIDY
jgi:hypothetical protein